jgi:predicted NBD/HSP70 family sugar kinase
VAKHVKGATAVETHSAILDLIRSSQVVSRIELADRSGLTGASISRIVRQLLDDGLVVEIGVGDATGGKRRTLLQLNSRARHAVGISLDFASVTYLVTDLNGVVLTRQLGAGVGHEPPRMVTQRVAEELGAVLAGAGVDRETLVGVGIAVPGRQNLDHEALRGTARATDWELFALEDTLGAVTDLPVVVENDSTCAAIGEYWVEHIPATTDFATVYMASGFGLGLVTQGDVYRGASANVGEIGHMVVDVNGKACWCGSRGCLEALAGTERIVDQALADRSLAQELGLTGSPDETRADFNRVARAAAGGESRAVALIEESAGYLATALLSATNLLDLDHIILSGPGFIDAGDIYLRVVSREVGRLSFARAVHPTRVGLSAAGTDSPALGAASLVLHSGLTPHQTSRRLALTV